MPVRPLTHRLAICERVVSTIFLRRDVEVEKPLELTLEFLGAFSTYEGPDSSAPSSFDESDLRRANRGGARISAPQIREILERCGEIEQALRGIEADASLAARVVPWDSLRRLFDAFADIRGVGFSKTTKALHPKRPALIPMLDSVVQTYLTDRDPRSLATGSFGERGTALVRSYKRDLDRNRSALLELRQELASRGYRLTEVRILDVVIWSACAAS